MLVLTRRRGESIQIGEDIVMHVLSIDKGQIRVGFSAPKETKIVLTELLPEQSHPTPVRK